MVSEGDGVISPVDDAEVEVVYDGDVVTEVDVV